MPNVLINYGQLEAILPLVLLAVLVPLSVYLLKVTGRLRALPPRCKKDPSALFQVVEALILHRPFTRRDVRRIAGISLPGRDPGKYFVTFLSGRQARGIILAAEVRRPTSASSKKDGMVVLRLNTRAQITPEAVMKRFGPQPDFLVPHPEAPFGCTYRYRQPWGDLSFQFTRRPEYLDTVVIDAIDPHPAAMTGDGTVRFMFPPSNSVP